MAEIDPEQPAFIRVPVKAIPYILKALIDAGMDSEARNVVSFASMYMDPKLNAIRETWFKRAEETRARDGDIEFDSDATISQSGDGGEYVLGWIWVEGSEES